MKPSEYIQAPQILLLFLCTFQLQLFNSWKAIASPTYNKLDRTTKKCHTGWPIKWVNNLKNHITICNLQTRLPTAELVQMVVGSANASFILGYFWQSAEIFWLFTINLRIHMTWIKVRAVYHVLAHTLTGSEYYITQKSYIDKSVAFSYIEPNWH